MTSLNLQVSKFLSEQPLKLFIGGRWGESLSGETFETLDPGEGKVLAKVSAGDVEDVKVTVSAAHTAGAERIGQPVGKIEAEGIVREVMDKWRAHQPTATN